MTRQNRISHFLRRVRHSLVLRLTRFRRTGTLVFILVAFLSAVLCALPFIPVRRSISEGTVVSADMVSRRDIVYIDNGRTEDLRKRASDEVAPISVSYTHLRAHETRHDLVCRLLLEKKKNNI